MTKSTTSEIIKDEYTYGTCHRYSIRLNTTHDKWMTVFTNSAVTIKYLVSKGMNASQRQRLKYVTNPTKVVIRHEYWNVKGIWATVDIIEFDADDIRPLVPFNQKRTI